VVGAVSCEVGALGLFRSGLKVESQQLDLRTLRESASFARTKPESLAFGDRVRTVDHNDQRRPVAVSLYIKPFVKPRNDACNAELCVVKFDFACALFTVTGEGSKSARQRRPIRRFGFDLDAEEFACETAVILDGV